MSASSHLATYLGEIGARDLLEAADECELACYIERLELEMWDRVLACESEDTIAARLTPTEREKVQLQSPGASYQLRDLDPDRRILDSLVVEVDDPELCVLARAHKRARDQFVERNLRLVVSFAARYPRPPGVSIEDMIQEGNLGLIKAVNRFRPRLGYRFSTYATWWIRHHISRYLAARSRVVRLPMHVQDSLRLMLRVRNRLLTELGRAPTDHELARGMEVPLGKVRQLRRCEFHLEVSFDQPPPGSLLDTPLLERLDSSDLAAEPTARIRDVFGTVRAERALERLSPIQADIIRRRFGFTDGREWTLREVGELHGLTRERIRQLQVQAIERLRRSLT